MTSRPSRTFIFAVVTVVLLAFAVGYTLNARKDKSDAGREGVSVDTELVAEMQAQPHLYFRNLLNATPDRSPVGIATLDDPGGARANTKIACDRVYSAAGKTVCLTGGGGFTSTFKVRFYDDEFVQQEELTMPGIPSRVRISSDGRLAASTAFVEGHSYAAPGAFSTETMFYDMKTRKRLGNLETFEVKKDGSVIDAPDVNYWGVTFAKQRGHFYATMNTAGKIYLIEGNVLTKKARVINEGIECPSLSPDGKRIAFKQAMSDGSVGPITWRIAVFDLESGKRTTLAETRNVDDQPEWLDDDTVLYGLDTGEGSPDILAVDADGGGKPRLFVRDADSPTVLSEED